MKLTEQKYISLDNREFDTIKECETHELFMRNKARIESGEKLFALFIESTFREQGYFTQTSSSPTRELLILSDLTKNKKYEKHFQMLDNLEVYGISSCIESSNDQWSYYYKEWLIRLK